MTFVRGNAYVEDDVNHGIFEVAEFKAQPERLLSKIDAEAAHKGWNAYKSTVSLEGFEFTCARCGDHYLVVKAMTASEPTEFTNQDLLAEQNRMRPFLRRQASSRECEIPMS
jgi:hypothetical protein